MVHRVLHIIKAMFFFSCCSVPYLCPTLCDPMNIACQAAQSFNISQRCPNSCPLSGWCNPTISSSVAPFSSFTQSFPALGSFLMSQLFTSGHQSIGAGASAASSVLPMNIQGWFPLGLTALISLQSKGLDFKRLLQYHSSKASILRHSAFFTVQLSHPYMTTGKTIALTRWIFVGKVMSLLLICCQGLS